MEKAINYAKVIEKKEVNAIQQGRGNTNNQPCDQHYTNRGNTHRNNYRDNTYRDNTTTIDTTRHEDAITAATQDITDVDVDPTPRLATLQPNVTTAADPTHTKEEAVYDEAELPHRDSSTVTVAVAMVTEAEDAET